MHDTDDPHLAGRMNGAHIGYARDTTTDQDLTAQRDALLRMGVEDVNIYVDHGLTAANRARPGLREALAAVRTGDTLVVTRLLLNVLTMVAEIERDLISMRTREGMAVARAKGRLKGKQPKLSKSQRKLMFEVHDRGEYTQTELAGPFSVSRATVYRELQHRRVQFLASCKAHIF